MTVQLPEPIIRGSESARCVFDVMRPRSPEYENLFHPGQEQLGHYYLPPFQRPPRWSDEQAARLIESMHLGVSIGSIVVSGCRNVETVVVDGVERRMFPYDSDWLIDGQQRLRAIRSYLADELTVFAGTPHEHRWSNLSQAQQRRFENMPIGFIKLGETDAAGLERIYLLMNYGGSPHTEAERPKGGGDIVRRD